MRTLLRHAPTGLYVQSGSAWTSQSEEAFDFKSMGRAIRFATEAGFTKMQVAFVSGDHHGLGATHFVSVGQSLCVRDRHSPAI